MHLPLSNNGNQRMNLPVLIPVGLALIALVVFLFLRNRKDEKSFEQQLNEDYHKSKDEENDIDAEELPK